MKVTALERAIFRMSPAEFNAYLAAVKDEVASEADDDGHVLNCSRSERCPGQGECK